MQADVRKAFEQALDTKVSVPRGERNVLMTRVEIGIEQLLNRFAKGERYAVREVLQFAAQVGSDYFDRHKQIIEEALGPANQAILDAYVARRTGTFNVAPVEPVLAPPELLDDESPESEPERSPEPEPEPDPKPTMPLPTPEPGKNYPKPPERMTQSELASWYPEWWTNNWRAWGEAKQKVNNWSMRQMARPQR